MMRRRTWTIARLMADVAIFSVGLAALHALLPFRVGDDPGVGVLTLPLALILTTGADRAVFGGRSRAFWLGFAATGWLCAAVALMNLHATRSYLLRYGPPVVRARQEFLRQHVAVRRAEAAGLVLPPPVPVSEWILLASALTEVGLGLGLGLLAASAGGLVVASPAWIARARGRGESFVRRAGGPD